MVLERQSPQKPGAHKGLCMWRAQGAQFSRVLNTSGLHRTRRALPALQDCRKSSWLSLSTSQKEPTCPTLGEHTVCQRGRHHKPKLSQGRCSVLVDSLVDWKLHNTANKQKAALLPPTLRTGLISKLLNEPCSFCKLGGIQLPSLLMLNIPPWLRLCGKYNKYWIQNKWSSRTVMDWGNSCMARSSMHACMQRLVNGLVSGGPCRELDLVILMNSMTLCGERRDSGLKKCWISDSAALSLPLSVLPRLGANTFWENPTFFYLFSFIFYLESKAGPL